MTGWCAPHDGGSPAFYSLGPTEGAITGTCLRQAGNAEFTQPPRELGSAFVACRDRGILDDVLCEHCERTVRKNNGLRMLARYSAQGQELTEDLSVAA